MDTAPPSAAEHDPAVDSLSREERGEAVERAGPRSPVVYAAISARGMEELGRPLLSLVASALAAGLLLSISVVTQGLLMAKLPAFEGRDAVADLGYTLGFVLVILGRLLLFTENTITPVLPILADPTAGKVARLGRLWVLVLVANLVGTFVAAWALHDGGLVSADALGGIMELSASLLNSTWGETMRLGIISGLLIAALVWCMPSAPANALGLTVFITYVIALGDFTHVIVGSTEAFLLLFAGRVDLAEALGGLVLPMLIGNVIGGTALFATLAYVQVRDEIAAGEGHGRSLETVPKRR